MGAPALCTEALKKKEEKKEKEKEKEPHHFMDIR